MPCRWRIARPCAAFDGEMRRLRLRGTEDVQFDPQLAVINASQTHRIDRLIGLKSERERVGTVGLRLGLVAADFGSHEHPAVFDIALNHRFGIAAAEVLCSSA